LVIVVVPAAALAKDNQPQLASFTVAGTNGYSLDVQQHAGSVAVVVSEETPPIATISITGGIEPPNRGTVTATSYLTQGQADRNLIEADLGSLGRISVSFQPSGKVRVTQLHLKKCSGPHRFVRRLGTFTGTIEFHGEGDYTAVDAITAPGSVGDSPFTGCYPKISSPPGLPILEAFDRLGKTAEVVFRASGGPRPLFAASRSEMVGEDVLVSHQAQAIGPSGSFDSAGGSVSVAPPPPIAGSAVLRHASRDSRTWTGDLSINFPGLSPLSLTGPSFHTRLSGY
jgi:hypothetical protein